MDGAVATMISLIGDVRMCTRCVQQRLREQGGFHAAIAELQRSDLVIANLEMPLSRRGYFAAKHSNLRADPEVIEDVRAMGVDAVTLANNHMMDFGPEAMFDTVAACDRAGISHCGAGANLESALHPIHLDANGCRVALLSVATTLPVGSDAGPGKPGVAPIHVGIAFEVDGNLLVDHPGMVPTIRTWVREEDQERVCQEIRRLKEEADLVVAGIHWGVPDQWVAPIQGPLAQYQRPLAHALIDAGADVVYGHHSHSIHPIEIYQGKPVFYSLGNFLFEFDRPRPFMEKRTIIARLTAGSGSGAAGARRVRHPSPRYRQRGDPGLREVEPDLQSFRDAVRA